MKKETMKKKREDSSYKLVMFRLPEFIHRPLREKAALKDEKPNKLAKQIIIDSLSEHKAD